MGLASEIFARKMLQGLPSAISSPESVAGPSPCNLPGGLSIEGSGPAPAHANLSVKPVKRKAKKTTDTSDRISGGLSLAAYLQQLLENRLRANLDVNGSPECELTWKHWDIGSDYFLVPCADGKTRRLKSGLAPLVDGFPGRVGQLRGYGNAIVPQVAAEFIKAILQVEKELIG